MTLEQGKDSLRAHMSNMGKNVDDPRVRNRIAIIDLSDLRVQLDEQGMSNRVDWMGQLIKQLTNYRKSIGFELLVFDSLGAFFTLTKMENPRDEIFRLFEAVRRLELTSFFICEMTGEDNKQFGEYGVEDYLSDGVIHLVMDRKGDDVQRKLGIVKMRHTRHALGHLHRRSPSTRRRHPWSGPGSSSLQWDIDVFAESILRPMGNLQSNLGDRGHHLTRSG